MWKYYQSTKEGMADVFCGGQFYYLMKYEHAKAFCEAMNPHKDERLFLHTRSLVESVISRYTETSHRNVGIGCNYESYILCRDFEAIIIDVSDGIANGDQKRKEMVIAALQLLVKRFPPQQYLGDSDCALLFERIRQFADVTNTDLIKAGIAYQAIAIE